MPEPRKNCEPVDNTPVALPLGYVKPPTIEQMIARAIRAESILAQRRGAETFEEADDFDTNEGDDNLTSKYEVNEMQEEVLRNGKFELAPKAPANAPKQTPEPVVPANPPANEPEKPKGGQ